MIKQKKLGDILFEENMLKTPSIIEAFNKIDRADFVLAEYSEEAYNDYPLPIGYNQTISQPSTIAFMLEILEPKIGNKVLDVGSGSGWTTALLAQIAGNKGKVYGSEIIPELAEFGQKNLKKYPELRAKIFLTKKIGLEEKGQFDRILVSATSTTLPEELLDQLKIGGTMVLPILESLWRVKKNEDNIEFEEFPGFLFVPLQKLPLS